MFDTEPIEQQSHRLGQIEFDSVIFGSVSFDQLPQVKKSFTFPFANINVFVVSSKMQNEDIILGQHDLGKLARQFGEIGFQKKKQTNKRKNLVMLFLVRVTSLRGLLTTPTRHNISTLNTGEISTNYSLSIYIYILMYRTFKLQFKSSVR